MFDFDPFEVGNYSTIGFMDELQAMSVRNMINDIKINYPRPVSKELVERKMLEYRINYNTLPKYLLELIDQEIDVRD